MIRFRLLLPAQKWGQIRCKYWNSVPDLTWFKRVKRLLYDSEGWVKQWNIDLWFVCVLARTQKSLKLWNNSNYSNCRLIALVRNGSRLLVSKPYEKVLLILRNYLAPHMFRSVFFSVSLWYVIIHTRLNVVISCNTASKLALFQTGDFLPEVQLSVVVQLMQIQFEYMHPILSGNRVSNWIDNEWRFGNEEG